MSRENDERDSGTLKRLSNVFSNINAKLHRDRGEREPSSPKTGHQSPGSSRLQDQSSASGQFFFEYLVVVSLKKRRDQEGYEPQITYQFPKRDAMGQSQREDEEKSLKAIPLFCFPEGVNWAPLTEYTSETFSFVLTEIDGSRRNGYCRRLLPSGKGARAPEAYCIISRLACFGLFSKIFDEVEKRRQKSMAMIYPFMQSLREASIPAPGHTVKIKSFIPESGTEIISLTRPVDSWLEHVDFRTLFRYLSDEEVLLVFAATVLERRIIFIADELSTLSQVIHAVAALLYPFTWQHTFISIVPKVLIDVVMAPTPYLLGVTRNMLDLVTDQSDDADLFIVDLSDGAEEKFIMRLGDEDSIIPPKLKEDLLTALSVREPNSTAEELNRVISEAFLSFFVNTVGHFASHVKHKGSGGQPGVFNKKAFCKAPEHKANRHFVKQFVETQMFDIFIQEVEKHPNREGFFHKKVAEYEEKRKSEKVKNLWGRVGL
ncbi:DENN/MADD domain containing 2Db [Engraulis encrasicolus]|uniref:DENN/MADD domain containing 2Db n=1 Tax=Engraulis encrasicolus TaxID=184585 RepID=UPI002FD3DFCE